MHGGSQGLSKFTGIEACFTPDASLCCGTNRVRQPGRAVSLPEACDPHTVLALFWPLAAVPSLQVSGCKDGIAQCEDGAVLSDRKQTKHKPRWSLFHPHWMQCRALSGTAIKFFNIGLPHRPSTTHRAINS